MFRCGLMPLALGSLLILTGCFSATAEDSAVSCGVNIFRSWKKIDGYETPRSKAELKLNFDVLIVERGDQLCEATVENGAVFTTPAYTGTYSHQIESKILSIEYDSGIYAGSSDNNVRYTITGSCSSPRLNLEYSDGTFEAYESYSTDSSCGQN